MFDIFKELINIPSVSGAEQKIAEKMDEIISGCCDKSYKDILGNLIVYKKGISENAKKIAVAAHMDEIGFVVTYIEDNGWIKVARVGGINYIAASYNEVLFENGVSGIIVPENKLKADQLGVPAKYYVDIGAKNKEEAEKIVKMSDTCTIAPKFIKLSGERFAASKLDDKIGCAILIQTILDLKNIDVPDDIYFIFTVQEEVGIRGAKTSSYSIMPDYSIAIDVTSTGDTPECDPMAVKLGGGAAIKVMDSTVICHRHIINTLESVAKEENIPYQREILVSGGTDTSAMQAAGDGSLAGALSVPTRYIHTGVEMCDSDDVRACQNLLTAVLKQGF